MTGNAVGGARVKALNRRSQTAAIEQFRAYITVTSLAAACALWWQNGNKWSETGKIQLFDSHMLFIWSILYLPYSYSMKYYLNQ